MNAFLIIETQVFHIPETTTKIGRSLGNHLVISEPQVSRHHAIIEREEDHFVIVDMGSTFGTFVNGERIEKVRLQTGDSILVANVPLVASWPIVGAGRDVSSRVRVSSPAPPSRNSGQ